MKEVGGCYKRKKSLIPWFTIMWWKASVNNDGTWDDLPISCVRSEERYLAGNEIDNLYKYNGDDSGTSDTYLCISLPLTKVYRVMMGMDQLKGIDRWSVIQSVGVVLRREGLRTSGPQFVKRRATEESKPFRQSE